MSWRVASLRLPPERLATDLSAIASSPAVQLFVERATAAQAQFRLTEGNAQPVAQICRRLDGIPLALELAAARVGVLTPKELTERIDQRFSIFTRGSRTTLPRQQTLQATMDWSYQLLTRSERRLFERLSVFAGGWTLDAAEHVCCDATLPSNDMRDVLSNLIQKSLVVVDEPDDHESRFSSWTPCGNTRDSSWQTAGRQHRARCNSDMGCTSRLLPKR
jgi:non-specific serine/threonine protein kinase